MKKKDKYKRMKPEATASRMTATSETPNAKKGLHLGKVSPFSGKPLIFRFRFYCPS